MKQTKRILSVVLCLLMVIAVVPVINIEMTASAVTYNGTTSYMNGQYYRNLCAVSLTGNQAKDIVKIAESQIGYKSGSSNSDLSGSTSSTSNVKYSEYGYQIGSNPNDWCAYFVSWCARRAGISTSILPNFAGCTPAYNSTLPNAGCTMHSRSSGYAPVEGDLIFFATSSSNIYHVGIVKSSDANYVYYIDGNNTSTTPHCVHDSKISRSYSELWGYATPQYTTITYTQPPTAPTVSVDKKVNLVNEQVTIRIHAERASNYWVGVYKDNVLWSDDTVYGNTYTVRYEYVGKYDVAVVARNNCGSADGYASFKYGNKGDYKPSSFSVSSDKAIAYRNEAVKLSFSANDADSYWIGVYTADGYLYADDVVTGNSYTTQCPWLGNYSIAIVAMNDCTSSDTKYIKLTVVEQKEFNVSYIANGGSGAPAAQIKTYGKDLTLSSQKPTRSGYTFVKWNTKADGSGTNYNASATYTGNADLTLYAIWQQNHTHSYTSTITKAATCISTGIRTYTCSCGDSYTETIGKNASNHVNTTNVAAVASTCAVKGYSAGIYCNDCKKYISGHAEQPLAAHTTELRNAREATCTAEGYTGDQYCTTCKQTISKGSATNALGHANADDNGNCTRCGAHIKDVTQPTQPQPQPQPSGGCKYCGGTHSGPFGWLIQFFHNILAIFKR